MMRICQSSKWVSLILLGWLVATAVEAASPNLRRIRPQGAQRGTEVDIRLDGARLEDAEEILFHSPGFETVKFEVENDRRCKATIKIAPDCALGEHAVRIRSASGVSELVTFFVGNLPEAEEKEPNNEFEAPQPIDLNVTVTGVIQTEDVDYYVVEAKQGQRISAEIEGLRLGNTMFDPYLAILDADRFELAVSDDSALLRQDPVASIIAPKDGKYYIMIREAAYQGNGACVYRAHIGTFPRPLAVYPAGGQAGTSQEVTFLGDPSGEFKQTIQLPNEPTEDFCVVAQDGKRLAPSGNCMRVSPFGNALEVEPNNTREEATSAELPNAFNGIIGQPEDEDYFRFTAKKGQRFDVRCFARTVRSPLDPVVNIYNAKGGGVAGNDDSGGLDSRIDFRVPADGEYFIRVRDHLGRGGPTFVYRIELLPLEPELSVSIPSYRRYSQERHMVSVPRNNRYATLMNLSKRNYRGEVNLKAGKLPPGVKMTVETVPANLNSVPVLFEAKGDAPLKATLSPIKAEDTEGKASGGYRQSELMVRGPRNTEMWNYTTKRLPIAVTKEAPFKLELVQPKVPLVQSGSTRLKVIAHRQKDFDGEITLQFLFRPPGINAASSVKIPKGKNEAYYPINASGNAQANTWKVLVIGSADVNGPLWLSSQFVDLTVTEPYVTVDMQRAAVEQGETAQILAKFQHNTAFEGKAKIQLIGLPEKLQIDEMEITKDTEELIFTIPTDENSPVGKHRNLFCRILVPENGELINHSQGKTDLQVDKPLPKKVAVKPKPQAKKPEPKKKEEPKERPLSRLEKLRLAAEELAKQQAQGAEKQEEKK